jgi:DNA polymerase (family 10)
VPLRNADVASLIERLGDLYEIDGAVVYRVLAYRRAAARIRETGESVERLSAEGRLTELPDVGATIAAKIEELRTTGSLVALEKLESRYPAGLVEIMHLPGVGAKTTRKLFDALGVTTVDELRLACETGRVRDLKGLGARAEEKILAAIASGVTQRKAVVLLDRALARAGEFLAILRAHPACAAASEAGSLRRRRETVGDIDLIAASDDPPALLRAFVEAEGVAEVTGHGDTKASIVGHDGVAVDLRVVPPASYGNLLQHFTGSKDHNVAMREAAVQRGLSVSEWGIENVETGDVLRTEDEDEVYRFLGYAPIPPELREDSGELEAAREGRLPQLVELADVRGDLHTHTVASDGKATIGEMALAAAQRGYAYLALTDHSAGVGMGIGLEREELLAHAARIREHAARAPAGLTLLAGVEVDVMADASLYLDDDVLAGLDWVVASVHVAQSQSRDRLTARLVAAASHPQVDVVGHPSGRQLGQRDPYDYDAEALIAACAEHGTALEVNASPRRLDLPAHLVRLALQAGVRIAISTDAHRTTTLANMQLGVFTARRGWATAADVLNARDLAAIAALRKPSRPPLPGV